MLTKALKSCPKSNKSPNLVTLYREESKIPFSYEETLRVHSKVQSTMLKISSQICPIVEVFEANPDFEKFYDMRILGCHPDYRGRGIASQLIRQSLQVLELLFPIKEYLGTTYVLDNKTKI